ncbi:MAG: serine/threonine-protein kinase [Planctomycetota bacterium]
MTCVDETRQQLIDNRLLSAEAADSQVARWREETKAPADAPGEQWVDWLVEEQLLTEFQGDALRAGHTGPFMLGPYRVFGRVALGRLGNIYRAVHEALDQPVSLKVFPSSLKDDAEKVARMRREFRVSVELEHANLLRTFQIGQVGDVYYLAFEDLVGETLLERLDREGALPYREACKLIRAAALSLAYLDEKGLVHRDVHPGNMWITETGVLKMMELGAVRDALGEVVVPAEEEAVTTSETVIGTFDYMAPEQAQDAHAADHRSDIYSLGCALYHCLTGKTPFKEKNPIKLVIEHMTKMPPPVVEIVPEVPEKLSDAVHSMIAKSPDDRFQKASDVAWALERYVDPSQLVAPQLPEVSPEYLEWLGLVSEKAAESRSPELAAFLSWLADHA